MQSMRVCPLHLHTRPHIPSYAWVWFKLWPFIPLFICKLHCFSHFVCKVCRYAPPLTLYFRPPLHWSAHVLYNDSSSSLRGGGLLNGRIWAKNRQRGGLNEFNGILFFWVGEGGRGGEGRKRPLTLFQLGTVLYYLGSSIPAFSPHWSWKGE